MEQQPTPLDIAGLEQRLGGLVSVRDEGLGEGKKGVIAPQDARRVEITIFPDTQAAKIHTSLADVTLRQAEVFVNEEHAVLEIAGATEQEWIRAQLYDSGSLILASIPQHPAAEIEPVLAASREVRAQSDEPAAELPIPSSSEGAPNKLEHERVTLTGRVGIEPRYRTTKNDTLVCTFPLAVHDDAGNTSWRDVVVFGERAIKLQGSLRKGQEVEVIGYVHTQIKRGKGGTPKEKHEIWAAVVRRPSKLKVARSPTLEPWGSEFPV